MQTTTTIVVVVLLGTVSVVNRTFECQNIKSRLQLQANFRGGGFRVRAVSVDHRLSAGRSRPSTLTG